MPDRKNPFSPFADSNSFLGRPFLPALGQAISDFGQTTMRAITPQTTTPPSTLAGVTIPPAGAAAPNLNPFPFLASLNPLGNRPLIRTDYGERPVAQPQVVPQLPSGATSYGASRTTQVTPVPLPTFPSQASVGSSMVSAVAPTLPTAPQPSPILPTPPSDGRFKFTFQGAEPMSERRGTIMATPEQLTNLASRQTAYEGRTPEQQAALLANIRKTGAGIKERIASSQINSFRNRPESTPTYTTPSGAPIKAPTNMFGRPNASFTEIYGERSPVNEAALARMGRGTRTSPAASVPSAGVLASTGFGAMQREQAAMVPPTIRQPSLFGGIGYASTLGGPQPASSMASYNPIEDRTRRRFFGAV